MGEGPPGVFLGVVEEEFGEEGEGEEEEDGGEGLGWHFFVSSEGVVAGFWEGRSFENEMGD